MQKITCPLTNIDVEAKRTSNDNISYKLKFGVNEISVLWCSDCSTKFKDIGIQSTISHVGIIGLIANNKLPSSIFLSLKDCDNKDQIPDKYAKIVVPVFFETISYPKTASEKIENLLFYLYEEQEYDGARLKMDFTDESIVLKNYFFNIEELKFYVNSLSELGLIQASGSYVSKDIRLTHLGLNKITEIEEKPIESKICFVAMAFSDETTIYRLAIKNALKSNGYDAVIIDEKHLESDETIPEAILNEIRKAKFCIADFTKHRNGVYFESGYALGLGKQVIYTCLESDFENAHFDIKQLQLLLYNSEEELEKRLTDKIEFWIK